MHPIDMLYIIVRGCSFSQTNMVMDFHTTRQLSSAAPLVTSSTGRRYFVIRSWHIRSEAHCDSPLELRYKSGVEEGMKAFRVTEKS